MHCVLSLLLLLLQPLRLRESDLCRVGLADEHSHKTTLVLRMQTATPGHSWYFYFSLP
jgi:hypothetical protein